MKAAAETYMIKTVARAMDLLDQFREGEAEFGITDLSNRLKLQKNNVFRLVSTLSAKKYIEINNSTGKYRLGRQARALGQLAAAQIDYVNHARPILSELKQQCHETCFFSINKDGYTYYLDGVESDLPVRVVQMAGKSRPLCCTAAGRVLLAFMEPQKLMNLLANSADTKGFTASTVTDVDLLQNDLDKVAWQGYAIDDQEHEAGVVEIAAPVFDGNGAVIGALSILGPKMRITDRRESELLSLLCRSAAHLSATLGFCRAREAFTETTLHRAQMESKARKFEINPLVYGGLKPCC